MSYIKIKNICKSFGKQNVLQNINLEIKSEEFITIFGPNGCGKTTLLNLIAGIIDSDSGNINIDNSNPKLNKFGFIFQNYRDSLLPWKTNAENILFPLGLKNISEKDKKFKLMELTKLFNITIPLEKYPYECSGGEQQLIAILREVISKPKLILMDEPFSSISHESKFYLYAKIQEIHKMMKLSTIMVTHNLDEAILLGTKIIIMSNSGEITHFFNITLDKPRTEKTLLSKNFIKLKNKINKVIK
jgi:NitT/TauT family transport system ATP-binding protein